MSIELAGVDFRLIHGQVITRWLTQCQINETVTIDTALSKDTFMQEVFKTAAPKGIKITIVDVEDAIKHRQEGVFDKDRVMVLFKGVARLDAVVQTGLKLEKIQIGGLDGGSGRKAVNNVITLDRVDIDTLLGPEKTGVKIYFRTTSDYPSETLQETVAKLRQGGMYMVIQAILIGILYQLSMGRVSYLTSFAFRKSVVPGVFIGLVHGDVQTGLLYGAIVQPMHMEGIEAGGNIPSDQELATCIAIPAVIADNLDPAAAVALAVPFGVLSVLINNVCCVINSFYNTKTDKFVEDKQYNKLSIFSFIFPRLANGVLYFIPIFIATLFDSSVVQAFINVIPEWVMDGLTNAGNTFLGLGSALTPVVIGEKKYLPFFVLGFFLYSVVGFSILTEAVIALCFALIISLLEQNNEEEVA